MNSIAKSVAGSIVLVLALIGLVVGLTVAMLDPPGGDLAALVGFLLLSGGFTVGLSLLAARFGLPPWVRSIRSRLMLVSVLTAILALGNIGFVALLMFLSTHDLALLAGLLSFSLGMSIFVAFALSTETARCMQEVVGAVRRINSGSLDTRVPVESRDEVGELAAAFNAMAQRLQVSFGRQRELEKARKELIGAVSHDLRTPLASIRVMIESINDGVVADDETIKRYLRTIQSEVENLSQLVNDLFELSQIDAGVLELHTEASLIEGLISDTVENMAAQAASRKLSLEGTVDQGLSPVVMDPHRVQRVLYNLLQNSIRHTPPDGTIRIRALDAGDEVEVQGHRHRGGHPGEGPAETLRAQLPGGPLPVEELRRRGPWPEHRQRHRRSPWGTHLGRERAREGQRFQLHPPEGDGAFPGGWIAGPRRY